MGSKRERQADRALVAPYDEARLAERPDASAAVDRFRAGEVDAFGVDDVIHQYKRAVRELWKVCWLAGAGAGVERTARPLRDMAAEDDRVDWWQRGAPVDREQCANRGERGKRRAHPLGRALRQALAQELVGRYLPPVCLSRVEAAYCFAPRA